MAKDLIGCGLPLLLGYVVSGAAMLYMAPLVGVVYLVLMPIIAVAAWKLGGPI